jgi:hypothetical protein
MIVSQINSGNIFEYTPIIGGESEIGIRILGECKETIQFVYCILDIDYCIMDPDFEVLTLNSIDKITIDDQPISKTKLKLSDVDINMVFQVSGPYGLLSTYCKTKFKVFSGIICVSLTTPTQIFHNVSVNDLGKVSDYNGLPDEGLHRIEIQ